MANTYLTTSLVTQECLVVLVNNLVMANRINRKYDGKFAVEGAKIGNTVDVRKPPRYVVSDGPAMVTQDYADVTVPVSLDRQKHVGLNFSSSDLLLSVDDFSGRVVRPALASLANKIDLDILAQYVDIYNFVGVPGTVPNALLTYLSAGVALDDECAPDDGQRFMVIGPLMQATIVNALTGLFHSGDQLEKQYEKGQMGIAAGWSWAKDQNVASHTVGAIAGTPTVNGAGQTGASIITAAWGAAATLKEGDIIQFAGVYAVNPQSYASTGVLRNFAVTEDVTASGAGAATIPISPSIVTGGSGKTVTATPAHGALISVYSKAAANFADVAGKVTRQGLGFHRDFATVVTADLPLPQGVDKAARASDPQSGWSVTLIRDFDIATYGFPCRVDVLYGVAILRPQLASRVCS